MHVVFGHIGQLVVHHVGQHVDVDATRGDVRGHQHLQVAGLELAQGLGAGALALVAVDGHGRDALLFQVLDQAVGTVLHAREHQHLMPVVGLDQVGQQVFLLLATDRVHLLGNGLGRGIATGDLDHLRGVQQAVGQSLDLVRERGREQQALLLGRENGQHALDVMHKAHVQHAVGLVQHEELDLAQVEVALLMVVQQAAGRGDQDVDAIAQARQLRAHAHATEHDHGLDGQVLAVDAHAFFDLGGQFTRGGQNQGADGALALRGRGRRGAQLVQQRQGETGGLASAGLCASQQVAASDDRRDGLGLNGGGGGIAGFGDGFQQRLDEPQTFKRHEIFALKRVTRRLHSRGPGQDAASQPIGNAVGDESNAAVRGQNHRKPADAGWSQRDAWQRTSETGGGSGPVVRRFQT